MIKLTKDEIQEAKEKLEAGDYDEEAVISYTLNSVSDDAYTIKVSIGTVNVYVLLGSGKRIVFSGGVLGNVELDADVD